MDIQRIIPDNRAAVNAFIKENWFTTAMVLRGRVIDMTKTDGYFASQGGKIIGLVTYIFYRDVCEITSLNSLVENRGLGTRLLDIAIEAARENGCSRVVLITTNDNIRAIRFYQKRGFDMAHLYRNALDVSRRLKPEIPLIGEDSIPLRHEIEFEMELK